MFPIFPVDYPFIEKGHSFTMDLNTRARTNRISSTGSVWGDARLGLQKVDLLSCDCVNLETAGITEPSAVAPDAEINLKV